MEPADPVVDRSTRRSGGDGGSGTTEGMESVVATVSGYHGGERFKLIKLITQSGANYVGAMSRSTTHLVCWRFEGKKYELAKSIGTHIVSPRWFEDCLKEGKRLPEGPYVMESGQEAGPIFEPSSVSRKQFKRRTIMNTKMRELPNHFNTSNTKEVVNLDEVGSDFEYPEWSDSSLLKEDFLTRRNSKKINSTNVNKRKRSSEQGYKSKDKDVLNSRNDVSGFTRGESSYSSSLNPSKQKGNSSALLQNNAASRIDGRSNGAYYLTESFENENLTESFGLLGRVISGSVETPRKLTHTEKAVGQEQEKVGLDESSRSLEIVDLSPHEPARCNEENNNKSNSSTGNVVVDNENANESKLIPEEPAEVPRQVELSCVICWTDFSATRGVLQCGHRFCYSCIQGWAHCLASKRMALTCPLCKACFTKISKVDEAGSSDQKIYSQTIPSGASIFMPDDAGNDHLGPWSLDHACCECHNLEPQELLVSCHICLSKWVHRYCLDPPINPWTCSNCRDLRVLYHRFRTV